MLVSIPGKAVGPLALEIKGLGLLVLSMVVQSGLLVASSCWNVLVVVAVIAWSFLALVSTYAVYPAPCWGGGRFYAPPPKVFRRYLKNGGAQRRRFCHTLSYIFSA